MNWCPDTCVMVHVYISNMFLVKYNTNIYMFECINSVCAYIYIGMHVYMHRYIYRYIHRYIYKDLLVHLLGRHGCAPVSRHGVSSDLLVHFHVSSDSQVSLNSHGDAQVSRHIMSTWYFCSGRIHIRMYTFMCVWIYIYMYVFI